MFFLFFSGDNSFTDLKTDFILGENNATDPFVRPSGDHIVSCNDYTNWDRWVQDFRVVHLEDHVIAYDLIFNIII